MNITPIAFDEFFDRVRIYTDTCVEYLVDYYGADKERMEIAGIRAHVASHLWNAISSNQGIEAADYFASRLQYNKPRMCGLIPPGRLFGRKESGDVNSEVDKDSDKKQ